MYKLLNSQVLNHPLFRPRTWIKVMAFIWLCACIFDLSGRVKFGWRVCTSSLDWAEKLIIHLDLGVEGVSLRVQTQFKILCPNRFSFSSNQLLFWLLFRYKGMDLSHVSSLVNHVDKLKPLSSNQWISYLWFEWKLQTPTTWGKQFPFVQYNSISLLKLYKEVIKKGIVPEV